MIIPWLGLSCKDDLRVKPFSSEAWRSEKVWCISCSGSYPDLLLIVCKLWLSVCSVRVIECACAGGVALFVCTPVLVCEREIRGVSQKLKKDIDMSRHARLRARVQRATRTFTPPPPPHTHSLTHSSRCSRQSTTSDRASRAGPAWCECVSSLSAEKGVIVLPACCHGYTVSTGRISAVKRWGLSWLPERAFISLSLSHPSHCC